MHARANRSALFLLGALLATQVCGCATAESANSALRLEESALEIRSLQTRKIEAPSETAILTATVALLQDFEFNIDRIEKPLGVISASKTSDADHNGEKFALTLLDIMCIFGSAAGGSAGSCDAWSTAKDEQALMLTMVVLPSLERQSEFAVRVTLQRIIYDKIGRIKILQSVVNPEIYEEIFDNLRSAIFIEVNQS